VFSKLMDQTTWLNDTTAPGEAYRRFRPHPISGVITLTYALPVGKGRALAFQSRWLKPGLADGSSTPSTPGKRATIYLHGTSSTTIGDLVYYGTN